MKSLTYQNILKAGKIEFLDNGFKDASLRQIVKNAGVTTGAFYGYFKGKEDLFIALVDEAANTLRDRFLQTQKEFDSQGAKTKTTSMQSVTKNIMHGYIDYMYEHYDAFKLIICCSEGTKYVDYIDSIMEIESQYTEKFFKSVKEAGVTINDLDDNLKHIVQGAYFHAIFEIVRHDMPKQKAFHYVDSLTEFFNAGWYALMGL
ncbi:MAG: TetR/AcrR family transcriptional regulator [Coprobacillaceae bacterium]